MQQASTDHVLEASAMGRVTDITSQGHIWGQLARVLREEGARGEESQQPPVRGLSLLVITESWGEAEAP